VIRVRRGARSAGRRSGCRDSQGAALCYTAKVAALEDRPIRLVHVFPTWAGRTPELVLSRPRRCCVSARASCTAPGTVCWRWMAHWDQSNAVQASERLTVTAERCEETKTELCRSEFTAARSHVESRCRRVPMRTMSRRGTAGVLEVRVGSSAMPLARATRLRRQYLTPCVSAADTPPSSRPARPMRAHCQDVEYPGSSSRRPSLWDSASPDARGTTITGHEAW
jgi:hypothetical protein